MDSSNKRIIKNSILLYVRMLFTVWINLYTTRLVLQNLGVNDYGVYGVVGSVVSIFTMFNGGLIKTIQRFITYELGKTNGRLNEVFNTVLNATFIFAGILCIFIEIVGLWYLNNHLNIPESNKDAAFWVFQCSTLTVLLSLINNPYDALVVAHEKMNVFAYISIIQSILGFTAAGLLKYISDNRLIYYAFFLMIISFTIRFIYQTYAKTHFKESKYRLLLDKKLLKDVLKFTGWTSVSSILDTLIWQFIVLIINSFFGVAVNAVYQISNQIRNSLLSFSLNLQRAIDPQITKSCAADDIERHNSLVYRGCKFGVYMNYFILIPCLNKTEYLLKLWLDDVPPYTVEFCQIALFMSVVVSGFELIRTSVLATGKIRDFMVIPSSIHLLSLLFVVGVANYIPNPVWTMFSIAIIYFIIYIIKLVYARRVTTIKLREFTKRVIYPCITIGIISWSISYFLGIFIPNGLINLLIYGILTSLTIIGMIYLLGLDKVEKQICVTYLKRHSQAYKKHKLN